MLSVRQFDIQAHLDAKGCGHLSLGFMHQGGDFSQMDIQQNGVSFLFGLFDNLWFSVSRICCSVLGVLGARSFIVK